MMVAASGAQRHGGGLTDQDHGLLENRLLDFQGLCVGRQGPDLRADLLEQTLKFSLERRNRHVRWNHGQRRHQRGIVHF
eukprot:614467-Rhodomonas_salina.2